MTQYPKVPTGRINVYYDAEFTGLHKNTSLVSVAFYCPQYLSFFYGEFNDYEKHQVDDWLQEHVIDNLMLNHVDGPYHEFYRHPLAHISKTSVIVKGNHSYVGEQLMLWFDTIRAGENPYTIQIMIDCYAYDWVLLNELICENGSALNIPEGINYIPIDLSTAFYMHGIDPDISREEYLGESATETLAGAKFFKNFFMPKHNSLWDAIIAYMCFAKLDMGEQEYPVNHRVYDIPTLIASQIALPGSISDKLQQSSWRGEIQHPES